MTISIKGASHYTIITMYRAAYKVTPRLPSWSTLLSHRFNKSLLLISRQFASDRSTVSRHAPLLPLFIEQKKIQLLTRSHIPEIFASRAPHLSVEDYVAAASVFPMRANNYVVDQLIDWSNVPNDPIFILVFPQPDMLGEKNLKRMREAIASNAGKVEIRQIA